MKFLIVDSMHESIIPLLKTIGVEGVYQPDIKAEEVAYELANEYQGLIVRSKVKVDEDLLRQAVTLKYVCRAGAGIDNLDVEYIERQGITILNAPEGNSDALAEHAIGLLLALLNNIVKSDKEVRSGRWDREGNRGFELGGRTVGLVGYGHMGQAFASRLSGFGCEVIAYDKYKQNFTDDNCREVSLEGLFTETDILSIHVPLTEETRLLFDLDFLSNFKKLRFLLNTSRGEVLDLGAVKELLQQGTLTGAALDVLENEKLQTLTPRQQTIFNFLASSNSVVLTPHVAGWSFESYEKINKVLVDKIDKEINGKE